MNHVLLDRDERKHKDSAGFQTDKKANTESANMYNTIATTAP